MAPYLIIYYIDIPEVEGSNIHTGKNDYRNLYVSIHIHWVFKAISLEKLLISENNFIYL